MSKKEKITGTAVKLDPADKVIRGFTYVFCSLFSLCCVFPFLLIVMSSFASEESIRRTGFTIWPTDFSTFAYDHFVSFYSINTTTSKYSTTCPTTWKISIRVLSLI